MIPDTILVAYLPATGTGGAAAYASAPAWLLLMAALPLLAARYTLAVRYVLGWGRVAARRSAWQAFALNGGFVLRLGHVRRGARLMPATPKISVEDAMERAKAIAASLRDAGLQPADATAVIAMATGMLAENCHLSLREADAMLAKMFALAGRTMHACRGYRAQIEPGSVPAEPTTH